MHIYMTVITCICRHVCEHMCIIYIYIYTHQCYDAIDVNRLDNLHMACNTYIYMYKDTLNVKCWYYYVYEYIHMHTAYVYLYAVLNQICMHICVHAYMCIHLHINVHIHVQLNKCPSISIDVHQYT